MTMTKPSRSKPRPRGSGSRTAALPLLFLRAFAGGAAAGAALLAVFALLFARTSLSLSLVKVFACAAAALCAMVSGALLANGLGRQKLLCGLGCGLFYGFCLFCATAMSGAWSLAGNNLTLLGALAAGGLTGGILSAAGPSGASPVRR